MKKTSTKTTKKKFLPILAIVFTVVMLVCTMAISVNAADEATTPTVSIDKFNLVFEDNVYLKYAVKFDGVEDVSITADNIGMLYFSTPQENYVADNATYTSSVVGYTTINGTKYYTFEYRNITAKQMTDYIYSVAYIDVDGERYYSAPVKYSVLEYAYSKLGKTGVASDNENFKAMLESMLEYGANAQKYFNYNTERLANVDYYLVEVIGGTLEDGFTKGLYHTGETATLTAREMDDDSDFVGWKNNAGEIVCIDMTFVCNQFMSNETYTAQKIYECKHTSTSVISGKAPTCTESGLTSGESCTDCGEILISQNTIEATGHSYFKLVCTECGLDKPASEGLNFAYQGWRFEYYNGVAIADYGNCKDKNIVIPSVAPNGNVVTVIGAKDNSHTFSGSGIKSIEIPKTVIELDVDCVFENCPYLTEIIVAEDNPYFTSVDGVLYNKNLTKLIAYPAGKRAESFVIPDSVKVIGEDAFNDCVYLNSITIPSSVLEIESGAFSGCYKLVEVINKSSLNIQKGSTDNGYSAYYAFEVHSGESKLTKLGDYIFYVYNGVNYLVGYVGNETALKLPESYNGKSYAINQYAFYHKYYNAPSSIVSIEIPSNVIGIGASAFEGCEQLIEVINKSNISMTAGVSGNGSIALYAAEVHKGTSKIVNLNDYLFYTINGVNYLIGYIGNDTELALPESFHGESYEIYKNAFRYCDTNYLIEKIVIPNRVTSIGNRAFYDCRSLNSITFSNNLTTIGASAFYGCTALNSVTIPSGVTNIGGSAFYGCFNLFEVVNKSSLEIIKKSTANGYVAYYAVSVSTEKSEIVNIDGFLFCHIDGVNYLIGYEGSSTELILPENCLGESYEIYKNAFRYCATKHLIKKIVIPNCVTNIGDYAFYECSSLSSITIPNCVTSIGDYAFYGCSSLSSITIPDSVTSIGDYAFYECSSLSSITIPNRVTSIGNRAFYGCIGLENITIPDSVTSIGYSAFYNCVSLKSVYITDIAKWCNIAFSDSESNPLYFGANLYVNGELAVNLVIPEGVTSIANVAFIECKSIFSVVIPSTVTSIGNGAFSGCTNICEVINNSSLNIVKGSYDNGYIAYYALEVHTGKSKITNLNNYLFYTYDGVTYLTKYIGGDTILTLPNDYYGTNYVIHDNAFHNLDKIVIMTIPNSVTSIGENAFYNCSSLMNVSIGNGIKDIGAYAFYGCASLETVIIPDNVTTIGSYSFGECKSLYSISIGKNVSTIQYNAFDNCYMLAEVINKSSLSISAGSSNNGYVAYYAKVVHTGESKIINIDDYIFCSDNYNRKYLVGYVGNDTVLTLPESCNGAYYEIKSYAFAYRDDIVSIVIPNKVTSIGDHAFYECGSLQSVYLGKGVTNIGYYAFYYCNWLSVVYYTGSETNWASISIGHSNTYLLYSKIYYDYIM